jgi:hypothetical protein
MTELTGILAEIAEVAGPEAARKIQAARGGGRVRLPVIYRPGCWLDEIVGETTARAIIAHFAICDAEGRPVSQQVRLTIGDAGTIGRALRQARETFARSIEAGYGVETAARRAGITERAGWKMKKRMAGHNDDGQGSLF